MINIYIYIYIYIYLFFLFCMSTMNRWHAFSPLSFPFFVFYLIFFTFVIFFNACKHESMTCFFLLTYYSFYFVYFIIIYYLFLFYCVSTWIDDMLFPLYILFLLLCLFYLLLFILILLHVNMNRWHAFFPRTYYSFYFFYFCTFLLLFYCMSTWIDDMLFSRYHILRINLKWFFCYIYI